MAEVIETAEGRLVVRDDTGPGVASAARNFERLNDVVRNNWWGLQNIGIAFAGLGGSIGLGVAESVKAAISFQSGMAGVRRTADLTIEETDAMAESIRQLALIKPVDVGVLADIAEQAGALGIAKEDIAEFTGVIADLVATTDLTPESATQLARLAGVTGLAAGEYKNLGSAILVAGRSTAATEQQIVSASVRLAGVGATAGLTADQIVAISAATLSLGSNAEAGASAIGRTMSKMAKAVGDGGAELHNFAMIAGYEGPNAARQFADAFQTSAAGALTRFVEGLGSLEGGVVDTQRALEAVGVTEVRERNALLQLANGTKQNVNSYLNLRNALQLTNQAYVDGTEVQTQAERLYETSSAQLKILSNTVREAGIAFGAYFLQPVSIVAGVIADIVYGFTSLPGPIQGVVAILGTAGAAVLLLAAAFITLGPRMVLVASTLRELRQGWNEAARSAQFMALQSSQAGEASAQGSLRAAFAAGRMSAAKREEAAATFAAAQQARLDGVQKAYEAQMTQIATIREQALAQAQRTRAIATELAAQAAIADARATEIEGRAHGAAAMSARNKANAVIASAEAAHIAALSSENLAVATAQEALLAQEAAVAERAKAAAEIADAGAATAAAGATYVLGAAIRFLLGPVGIAITVIGLLASVFAMFGHNQRESAKGIDDNVQANQSLTRAMREQAAGARDSVQSVYLQDQAFLKAAASANDYGYSIEFLYRAINGLANQQEVNAFVADLDQRFQEGDESAGALRKQIYDLVQIHNASARAAQAQASGEAALGVAAGETKADIDNLAESNRKLKDTHDQVNAALLALPDALLSQQEAVLSLAEAQDDLAEAQDAAARRGEAVAKAEDDLASARIQRARAAEALKDAEDELSTARQDAIDDMLDKEDDLLDAQDKLIDTQIKISDLELELAQLREGPSVDELRDATNKLANANIKLLDSQKKVGDAQYMLNYLLAEGASARDIIDAQDNLASAQQDVANATDDVIDAQEEYDDLINGPDPEELAAKERELAAARRDLEEITREIAEAEEDLAQAREDVANDTAYKEAQQELKEAQIALAEANRKVAEAQRELNKARSDDYTEDLARAQLRLEQAYYRLAKANVEVQKQTALAHGEQFGAGREAQALAAELDRLGVQAGGKTADDFAKYAAMLRRAKKDMEDLADAASTGGKDLGTPALAQVNMKAPIEKQEDGFWDWLKDHWLQMLAGALIFIIGGLVAVVAGVPLAIVAAVILALSAVIAAVIAWGPEIGGAFMAAVQWIWEALQWVWDRFLDLLGWIGGWIGDVIESIVGGFMDGLRDIGGFFTGIKDWFEDLLADIVLWGIDFLFSIKDAFGRAGSTVSGWVNGIATWIWDLFTRRIPGFVSSLPSSIAGAARDAFFALLGIFDDFPGAVRAAISGIGDIVKNTFKGAVNGAIGVWNAFIGWLADMSFSTPSFKAFGKTILPSVTIGFDFLNALKIPYLAEGGIVTNPTLAMMGERGSEAVLPLDRLFEMFAPVDSLSLELAATNAALEQLIALTAANNGATGGDTINVDVETDADAMEIAREVVWAKRVREK